MGSESGTCGVDSGGAPCGAASEYEHIEGVWRGVVVHGDVL